jgi:hypothetical protein
LLADIEAGVRYPSENNLSAIRTALEEAGVMFLAEGSESGLGVRLRKKSRR